MTYVRPKSKTVLKIDEKMRLLKEYNEFYANLSNTDPQALNIKIPRNAFDEVIDKIGSLLFEESKLLCEKESIKEYLEQNSLPPFLTNLLPEDFRVFCLLLNALKGWVAAEQQATDRYLLGGRARDICRASISHCIITGESLDDKSELHHPARDGRPPILISKKGHSIIEGQVKRTIPEDESVIFARITYIKESMHSSWTKLRKGCQELSGATVTYYGPSDQTTSRSVARKTSKELGLSFSDILGVLDENGV